MRQSGSKDDKLWQRGAGLRLDCSGTGTRLRADTIIGIQSALEPSQSHRTQPEALGEMKGSNVSRSKKLQRCLEHERASHSNGEINNHDADDRPDNKYLLLFCFITYVTVTSTEGVSAIVTAVLAVRSMALKTCSKEMVAIFC